MFDRNQINFKSNKLGQKDYLELRINEDIKIKDFEMNMLVNNPTLPFIKVEMRQINNEKSLLFDISDKTTLKEYIKINKITQRDFIEIVKSILSTLEMSKDYMLTENKVLINNDSIFIEQYSGMPYLMYLPVESQVTPELDSDFLKLCKSTIGKLQKNNNLQQLEKDILNELLKAQNLSNLKETIKSYTRPVEIEKNKTSDNKVVQNNETTNKSVYRETINSKELEERVQEEKSKTTKVNKSQKHYESVIEEDKTLYVDYDEEDDEEEDEDLAYEDYLHERKYYAKEKSDGTNRILVLQLIVVILIGSLVLLLSVDDKQFFMMMLGIIVLDVLFCVIMFAMNMSKKGKGRK